MSGSTEGIGTRYTAQSVMRTCMLPRELIWERGGSLSYWCDTEQWLALGCSYCEAHLKRATPLPAVRYTNYLLIIIIYYKPRVMSSWHSMFQRPEKDGVLQLEGVLQFAGYRIPLIRRAYNVYYGCSVTVSTWYQDDLTSHLLEARSWMDKLP